nr:hypothetical protein CFP56_34907 [Quercus suber]
MRYVITTGLHPGLSHFEDSWYLPRRACLTATGYEIGGSQAHDGDWLVRIFLHTCILGTQKTQQVNADLVSVTNSRCGRLVVLLARLAKQQSVPQQSRSAQLIDELEDAVHHRNKHRANQHWKRPMQCHFPPIQHEAKHVRFVAKFKS